MHSQQQFPLPPSITSSAAAAMMQHHRALNTMSGGGGPGSGGGGDSGSDAEDLRVPSSSPFGGSTGSGGGIIVLVYKFNLVLYVLCQNINLYQISWDFIQLVLYFEGYITYNIIEGRNHINDIYRGEAEENIINMIPSFDDIM